MWNFNNAEKAIQHHLFFHHTVWEKQFYFLFVWPLVVPETLLEPRSMDVLCDGFLLM